MERRQSRVTWARRIELWRRSGLSAREFAAREGVRTSTLTWWRWRLAREAPCAESPLRRGAGRRAIMPTDFVELIPTARARAERNGDRAAFDDYLLAIEHLEERLRGLEEKLAALSVQEPYRDAVGWLRCFRGIDTVTAMTIVTELHGFERFRTARELMSYLGLVPSEHSSGSKQRRGAITKAGNSHLRRVLIEAAWHYRHRPRQSAKLRQRREGQPAWAIAIADRAQQRLHKRFWRLLGHGKAHNKTVTAVARELVGFIWATLSQRERSVAVETPKESKTATTYRIKKVTDGAANRRRSGRRAAA